MPSSARKSPPFDLMTAPLWDWERAAADRGRAQKARAETEIEIIEGQLADAKREAIKAGNREAAMVAMREAQALAEELARLSVPAIPRILADDVTPEVLKSLLASQGGRISIMSPEGDIFSAMGGRHS